MTAFLLLASALPLALLFLPFTQEGQEPVTESWWDFAHTPLLFTLTLLAALAVRGRHALAFTLFIAWWTLLMLAVPAIEFIQPLAGRQMSWNDVFYGWGGGLAGLCVIMGIKVRGNWRIAAFATAALLWASTLAFPVFITRVFAQQQKQFPELAFFSSPQEYRWWEFGACTATPADDGWSVTLGDAENYSGLFRIASQPDWSEMKALHIELTLEDTSPAVLWLRADDQKGNPSYSRRFQKTIAVSPGRNHVIIPRAELELRTGGGLMNLHHIHQFGLFVEPGTPAIRLRLHRMHLELTGADAP